MKRLIINSDDYGRLSEVLQGIPTVRLYGAATSATCMMNIPGTVCNIKPALKETPTLRMGVRLVLTMGKPLFKCEAVKSVTGARGNFFNYVLFIENLPRLNIDEVKTEWRMQEKAFISLL